MRGEAANHLVTKLLCSFFIVGCSILSLAAQSFDKPSESKVFGSSLETGQKKDKKGKPGKHGPHINPNKLPDLENDSPNNDEAIRVETILIINEVLVLDKNGNEVKNLKKEDFIISEDDEQQDISIFLSGDSELIPRSIVLIIDYSGSQLPYIETSIEAAKLLVDKLNPHDRMAIVTDKVEILQNFTCDKILLKEKLESLKISALSGVVGTSRQYSALLATLNEMFDDQTMRPIIIFQTDGDELRYSEQKFSDSVFGDFGKENFRYQDILTAAEKTRATIYTIIPGMSFNGITEKERLLRAQTYLTNNEKVYAKLRNLTFKPATKKKSESSLNSTARQLSRQYQAITEIAGATGGLTNFLETPEQAEKVYSEVLAKMNMRYVIGYYPANQNRNGKTRKIITQVRGHPEYKVAGRETYLLP